MTRSSATVYTYAYTVGTGDGTATVALSTGTDLAGNVVTATPTSGTFTVDNTPPTISISAPSAALTRSGPITYTVTYADTNFNTSTLATGNIILNTTGTVHDSSAVTGSGLTRTVTISGITGDGTMGISIAAGTATDLAGNSAPAAGSSATFTVDNTPPTLSPVTIASNNSTPTLAKVGDTITLSFTSSQNIQTPTVTIAGHAATVSGANSSWNATYVMASGDTEGIVPFNIVFTDLAGNAGTAVTATTNSSSVTFDKTPPTISISAPSATLTRSGPITYTVTYADTNFNASTLATGNITLNTTNTATGTLGVSGTGLTRTVTISGITGDGTMGISIAAGTATDLAGNSAPAAGPSTTFTVDNTPPAAVITYSPNHPVKQGTVLTITATFSQAMVDSPAPQIAILGANTVSATAMTKTDATHYYYTYAVGTGNGPATVALSVGTDLAGNVVTAAPTSGATFTVDNIRPTAVITYSPNHAVNAGTSLIITATFNEAMANSPAPKIAISGANTLTATDMMMTDTTHYYYTFTVGTGNGTATVALSTGTDLAGNVVVSAPSGATFTVDNTPPTNQNTVFHSSTYKTGGAPVTIVGSGDATNNVWFAPLGTTTFIANGNMTTAGGMATSILAPADDGVYRMFVIDAAGNYSAASTATLTVDNISPTVSISAPSKTITASTNVIYTVTYADTNFYTSTLSSGNVTLNKTGTANATSKAVTGSGLTRTVTISGITGDGTLGISIAVGTAVDLAGNLAPAAGPSTTFIVDNTAPTNQNIVLASSVSQGGGSTVTIVSSGDATNNVWFAPSGTTTFIANGHMTTAGGTATSILAPADNGVYHLFVIDAAGNVSAASMATLTVSP
jgi:hypothetical protein